MPETKDKKHRYSPEDNTYKLDSVKNSDLDRTGAPKDEVNVVIGDDKQPEFYPQVKLCRWSNEVNFSLRLAGDIVDAAVETKGDKVAWSRGNVEIEFYDFAEGEGGYKLVWFLKNKPATNRVEFTIQSKGLDFFYQPPLTPEELAAVDFQGNNAHHTRPENVVGSYAVYYSAAINTADGKDYKTGKAFHIYRPHLIDAEGREAWGDLHIENGIYSVEIPEKFFETAVYPIKSNDTFGYTSAGASNAIMPWVASTKATPSAGTVSSISFYTTRTSGGTTNFKGLVFDASSKAIISNGITGTPGTITSVESPSWRTATYGTAPSVTATPLYAGVIIDGNSRYYYDTGFSSGDGYTQNSNNYGSPSNPTGGTDQTYKVSVYATYTPSSGGFKSAWARGSNSLIPANP